MRPFTVIFDSCVLFPARLRSLLMYLGATELFRGRWTNDIHEEWMQAANDASFDDAIWHDV